MNYCSKTSFIFFVLYIALSTSNAFAQQNIALESFTAFSWSSSNSYTSNKTIIANGIRSSKERGIGFGAGNEYGLLVRKSFDSSYITMNIGFSALIGKKQQTGYFENKDSTMLNYQIMDAFQLCALLGIGVKHDFTEKLKMNTDLMLSLPLVSRLRSENINSKENFSEQTGMIYQTKFSAGFNIRAGLAYKLTDNLYLKGDLFYTFMSLSDKKSTIKRYTSTNNQSLSERYPTISDIETIYFKELKDVKNDPILNPSGFSPNKASESVSTQLPFSRIGLSVSFVWNFEISKTMKNKD